MHRGAQTTLSTSASKWPLDWIQPYDISLVTKSDYTDLKVAVHNSNPKTLCQIQQTASNSSLAVHFGYDLFLKKPNNNKSKVAQTKHVHYSS